MQTLTTLDDSSFTVFASIEHQSYWILPTFLPLTLISWRLLCQKLLPILCVACVTFRIVCYCTHLCVRFRFGFCDFHSNELLLLQSGRTSFYYFITTTIQPHPFIGIANEPIKKSIAKIGKLAYDAAHIFPLLTENEARAQRKNLWKYRIKIAKATISGDYLLKCRLNGNITFDL